MPDIATATATRQGSRHHNADAAAIHQIPGTAIVGAAVVDGIGSSADIARFAEIAAEVAARVGARRTATIGILAAAELVSAPAAADISPDGVAVLAVAEPGQDTAIAWTGDARAYGWDGSTLRQLTTDQTVGEWLLQLVGGGDLAALAAHHDNWLRSSLGRCSIATVHATAAADPLVLLTSDGAHEQVPHEQIEALIRGHGGDLQALVDSIVAAALPGEDGYRDDATVIALRIPGGG